MFTITHDGRCSRNDKTASRIGKSHVSVRSAKNVRLSHYASSKTLPAIGTTADGIFLRIFDFA